MKYLLFKRSKYSVGGYELQEFATPEELGAQVLKTGLDGDIIVAQRIGVDLQICDWKATVGESGW